MSNMSIAVTIHCDNCGSLKYEEESCHICDLLKQCSADQKKIKDLESKLQIAIEALELYSDAFNIDFYDRMEDQGSDGYKKYGDKAREALSKIKEEGE